MNTEHTQPTNEVIKRNEDPKEPPLLPIIHRRAGPSPPSRCDTPSKYNSCATGDVVSANPSRTDAAGDVVSANPSHTADNLLSSTVCLPCNGADESLREAPNRILDWANLKTTIEKNLGNCKACKSPGLRLVQKNKVALCTEIAIICDKCDTQEKKLYQEIKYHI